MNYEQLIEELREEMLQLVNTKCDALLQMYRSGEQHTNVKDTIRESCLITVSPAELKGKRPLAVRSDDSHGDTLKYLKEKGRESLVNLSSILDDYVRRGFKKVIAVEELNYNDIPEEKAYVVTVAKPIIILFILGFVYLFIFQKFDVGIPCFFYGNFRSAWEYNALSFTVLPIVCIYLLYRSVREAMGKGEGFYIWEYILLAGLLIIALAYGYVRNKI